MRKKYCRTGIGLLLILSFIMAMMVLPGGVVIDATGTRYGKIKDVDVTIDFGRNGTMFVTDDGKYFVSGSEVQGEFGSGGAPDDQYNEFTQIDVSALGSPIVDIVSGMVRTTVLTADGRVFYTGGQNNAYETVTSFTSVDPALFGNSPVVKINRNIYFNTFLTADGKLYTSTAEINSGYSIYYFDLPDDGNGSVTPVQTMGASNGASIYLLDNAGRVWYSDNWYSLLLGGDPSNVDLNWRQILTVNSELVFIKQMVMIMGPYFLDTSGRVLYAGSYSNLNGEYEFTPDGYTMDFTDIADVESFVPFYAPTVHSAFPNVRKTDGHVYVGSEILTNLGAADLPTPAMIDTASYLPGSENASQFTIGQRPGWTADPYSAGSYVVDGNLYTINGDQYATNGILTEDGFPLPALTVTQFPVNPQPYVVDPNTPILAGAVSGNVNPATATMGPAQQSQIPVQANWQISDSGNVPVRSGTILETSTGSLDGQVAVLDIRALALSAGNYTLTFFRETTGDYTGTYMRSANTASAAFVIQIPGGDVTVLYVDEQGKSIASSTVLSGNIGEAFTTEAKTIPGYILKTTPDNASGTFTDQAQTVTYVYAPEPPVLGADVTVEHMDEYGDKIADSVILSGNLGEAYTTTPKTIGGYKLKTTPKNSSGFFTSEPQTVTYIYSEVIPSPAPAPAAPVTVTYVDEKGLTLAEPTVLRGFYGDSYVATAKAITGYKLISSPANASGDFSSQEQTVVFVYRKIDNIVKTGENTLAYGSIAGSMMVISLTGMALLIRRKQNSH